MSWKQTASSSGEGNFEVCPEGSHAAVCVGIIDLGTHTESFPGSPAKQTHKLYICWEIPSEKKSDGTSHVMGREYTCSFHEMAGLRKMVESWRNKKFAEGEDFDLANLLGKPCLLQVLNEDSKNGKTFAKINSVGALPKGMSKPTATLEPISFNFQDNTPDEFPDEEWLPWTFGQKLITKAMLSPEWRGKGGDKPSPQEKVGAGVSAPDDSDAAPF